MLVKSGSRSGPMWPVWPCVAFEVALCGPVWPCMALPDLRLILCGPKIGYVWPCVALRDPKIYYTWPCVALRGPRINYAWPCVTLEVALCGPVWPLYGPVWPFVALEVALCCWVLKVTLSMALLILFTYINIHMVQYHNCLIYVSLCTPFDTFCFLLYYTIFFFFCLYKFY